MLARLLREIPACKTLVVVRLDRLARSVGHLLAVIVKLRIGALFVGGRRGHSRSGGLRLRFSGVSAAS